MREMRKCSPLVPKALAALALLCWAILLCRPAVAGDEPFDLEAAVAELHRLGAPGALALLNDDGRPTRAATGLADVASGRPVTGDEIFRSASITKLFTGIVVLKLVRTGQVALADPIGWHLPRIVPHADVITVRQLLDHTSGIPDHLAGRDVPFNVSAARLQANLLRRRPREALLADAVRRPRKAAPGVRHDYSNTNYLLLELLVEKLAGKPYQEVVHEEVLVALGLERTEFPDASGRMPMPTLRGYVPADGPKGPFTRREQPVDVTEHDYFAGGDGGLYSTAADLARLITALMTGGVLRPDELATMLREPKEDHDGNYRYGLGIMQFPTACGRPVFGHEGRDIGTFSAVLAAPDASRVLVVAVNAAPDHAAGLDAAVAALRDKVFCR